MNVMAPTLVRLGCSGVACAAREPVAAVSDVGEDLMTRRQVAGLFGVTSAAVAAWARRGRLPEVRNEAGRPRYRRADVDVLFRSAMRQRAR